MNTFKKKANTYRIYCYLGKTVSVQKFAEKHSIMGTVVETRAHGPLLSKNLRVTVTFKSNDSESMIYTAFLNEFKGYDVKINGKSMFIYKEAGLI